MASAIQQCKSKITHWRMMGVRLYPKTKDAAALERLAGVPKGTMRLLHLHEEMEKAYLSSIGKSQYNPNDELDVHYDIYCLMLGTPVAKLQDFLLYGWGKFDYSKLPAGMQYECGELGVCTEAASLLCSSSGAMPHWDMDDAMLIVHCSGGVYWG